MKNLQYFFTFVVIAVLLIVTISGCTPRKNIRVFFPTEKDTITISISGAHDGGEIFNYNSPLLKKGQIVSLYRVIRGRGAYSWQLFATDTCRYFFQRTAPSFYEYGEGEITEIVEYFD